ncbi:unnamed protein product [Prorocentrum cordatum]|uniref:Uncharacterized protein n=1 Tax=Prorocentrum cordatum TaxID=2364126 RepID=A0ABN9UZH2_9DINO|nr:unnamed protein product [Polarella glacialis]
MAEGSCKVYLDIDIDGEKAAYELGRDFVDACDIKYSLSSKDVLKLGGSEIARLPELFESDFEWSQKGKALPPQQRVVIELAEKDRDAAARQPPRTARPTWPRPTRAPARPRR